MSETHSSRTENKYTCEECGKSFDNSGTFFRHRQIHEGVKWNCEECGKSFTQKAARDNHTKMVHSKDFEPLEYEFCSILF